MDTVPLEATLLTEENGIAVEVEVEAEVVSVSNSPLDTEEEEGGIYHPILVAIRDMAIKAKGRLANGCYWSYEHVTGIVTFSAGWSSRKFHTICDGVRKTFEWICEQFRRMFA